MNELLEYYTSINYERFNVKINTASTVEGASDAIIKKQQPAG